jgi:hypothetical protein
VTVRRRALGSRPKIGELNGKTWEKRRSKHLSVPGAGSQAVVVYDQFIGFEGSLIRIYEPVMWHLIPSVKLGLGYPVDLVSCG